jgi:hypothetical protein
VVSAGQSLARPVLMFREFGDGWDKKDKEETVKETEVILEI